MSRPASSARPRSATLASAWSRRGPPARRGSTIRPWHRGAMAASERQLRSDSSLSRGQARPGRRPLEAPRGRAGVEGIHVADDEVHGQPQRRRARRAAVGRHDQLDDRRPSRARRRRAPRAAGTSPSPTRMATSTSLDVGGALTRGRGRDRTRTPPDAHGTEGVVVDSLRWHDPDQVPRVCGSIRTLSALRRSPVPSSCWSVDATPGRTP